MLDTLKNLRHSLISRLVVTVGATLLLAMATWAFFDLKITRERGMNHVVESADQLSNTIKLGAHYAMMLNSRNDINQIIKNIGSQKNIRSIRIYNKSGFVKFSFDTSEVDKLADVQDEVCINCHRTGTPLDTLRLTERVRIFQGSGDERLLGIISPINNEPGCSSDCHFHPEHKQVLGILDLVVSLASYDRDIFGFERGLIILAVCVFGITSTIIFLTMYKFVKLPIQGLIDGSREIARGRYHNRVIVARNDEVGRLAAAINRMSEEIAIKQAELNRQRNEYQELFELVPCLINVVDRDYRLINFNREFCQRLDAKIGRYCYQAYKGRSEKCDNCPVEKTFADGRSHRSEESGLNRDGSPAHWIVITSPVKNENGETVYAMEISLDITERKLLEKSLEQSERKYHEIYNNIPNPVFVLDFETLRILDINESVTQVYGYGKEELVGKLFLDLFTGPDKKDRAAGLLTESFISQARQMNSQGGRLFVNIRVSPSEYLDQKVLLVTASDITKRLEAEQQLAQAAKLATLGEMATGVAHELNQPLSVIKTASTFLMKKIAAGNNLESGMLQTLLAKMDANVDRADKIIRHMRQFARKSEVSLEPVAINRILKKALDIFSQQLKARGIEVVWNLCENPPGVMADPDRLEQVFINLLINARDAIEEAESLAAGAEIEKRIYITSRLAGGQVIVEIRDTGAGISETVRDKVFDPFFTTKEAGKGTGLGLSISYGIVKECGGCIRLRDADGSGACFVVEFPGMEAADGENHLAGG